MIRKQYQHIMEKYQRHKGPVTREMFPFDDVILDHFRLRRCVHKMLRNYLSQRKGKMSNCLFIWWPRTIMCLDICRQNDDQNRISLIYRTWTWVLKQTPQFGIVWIWIVCHFPDNNLVKSIFQVLSEYTVPWGNMFLKCYAWDTNFAFRFLFY